MPWPCDLGNSFEGVWIFSTNNNTIGGTTPGARNIISGNDTRGVFIEGGTSNIVQGNYIGTDVNGTGDLGNTFNGVCVSGGSDNTIGGTTAAARNIISGNDTSGVFLTGSTTGNLVQGNSIGVDVNGATRGNGRDGVTIGSTSASPPNGPASTNTVGGTTAAAGNTIAFNGRDGVRVVSTSTGNAILSNNIFSNTNRGIDLVGDGVTANDVATCDPDTGPNNLQNFPVLTSVNSAGGSTTIMGSLDSTASTNFTVQFFSNAACDGTNGEGRTFIGETTVMTSGSCSATINTLLPVTVLGSEIVTATATDPNGNTSEFSACNTVMGPTATPTPTVTHTPTTTPTQTQTPTRTPTRTPTLAAPVITGGAVAGSTRVIGTGNPNGGGCITILDCGPDGTCGNSDDLARGTGDTDSSGSFAVAVSPALVAGHKLFAQDTCASLAGPAVIVGGPAMAPALSPAVTTALAVALGVAGVALTLIRRRC